MKNFIQNIKPIMLKINEEKKLSISERKTIVEFHLEVVHYVACTNNI